MRGLFLDATDTLADVFDRNVQPGDPEIVVNQHDRISAEALPSLIDGYDFILVDHSFLPTDAMRQCPGLKHVIFLGTGARSYMNPDELVQLGIAVHTIKGYGDVAVAEHTVALIWAAARGLAWMDRGMRAGQWLRTEGVQLGGIETLRAGRIAHAGLDVFDIEPLPPGHPFTTLDRVTLSAHSAFRTPEASDTLLRRALDIAKGL